MLGTNISFSLESWVIKELHQTILFFLSNNQINFLTDHIYSHYHREKNNITDKVVDVSVIHISSKLQTFFLYGIVWILHQGQAKFRTNFYVGFSFCENLIFHI